MNPDTKQQIDDAIPESLPPGAPARERTHPNARGIWNPNQWRAAWMRAAGYCWGDVCAYIGVSHNTATKYTQIGGWVEMVEWFKERAKLERLTYFLDEEEDLVLSGTRSSLQLMIDIITGEAKDGDGEDAKPASLATRARVARDFLRVTGYADAKRIVSRKEAELATTDPELEDELDDVEVDHRIEYEDAEIDGVITME